MYTITLRAENEIHTSTVVTDNGAAVEYAHYIKIAKIIAKSGNTATVSCTDSEGTTVIQQS